MADNYGAHKHLTLDDVQTIIGRLMIDESFRKEFLSDPMGTITRLGISTDVGGSSDQKAVELIDALAEALADDKGGTSLQDILQRLRDLYLGASDGVIRPRCG